MFAVNKLYCKAGFNYGVLFKGYSMALNAHDVKGYKNPGIQNGDLFIKMKGWTLRK